MKAANDAGIETAFNDGRILRTHMMRPTWHFVTPDDLRWMMELTAPRVQALNAPYYRKLELDDDVLARSNAVVTKALRDGRHLTRKELSAKLAESGIHTDTMRLGYIMHHAELELIVCSGPRRGNQFTYALVDERAPESKSMQRDEALAELARRYVNGHGPATARDFAWWSGLTLTDARTAFELAAARLDHEEIDGETYWFPQSPPVAQPSGQAFLLPTYDEYLIAFESSDRGRVDDQAVPAKWAFDSTIVIDGHIIGTWRRTIKSREVVIEIDVFGALTPAEDEAVVAAAERYGAFVGLPARIAPFER